MRKIISVILSVVVIVCLMSTAGLAYGEKEYFIENAFDLTANIDAPFVSSPLSNSVKIDFFSSENRNVNHKSYNLLNDNQKKIYDAVKNSELGTMSVSVTYDSGVFPVNELTNAFLTAVMNAISYDLPEFFYHAGCTASYSYNNLGYVTRIDYKFKLISVNLQTESGTITVSPTYTDSTVAACCAELESVLDSLTFDTSNRYNFVKDVHDYLCKNIIYPDIPSNEYVGDCHDAYGALVNGYAVCQGYAEAFKLICDKYNIPCVYITGTANGGGHGWNAVQMDDGKWYLVDATWDDQNTYLFYDFFLCGLNSVDKYFGKNVFSESHIANAGQLIPSLCYASDYYSQTNHYTKFSATYNNFADESEKLLYLSVFDAAKSNVYYDGIYVPVNDYATGETITVDNKTTSQSENWEIVLLGDTNSDGICGVDDYSAAVNMFLLFNGNFTSVEQRACDINLDGYIDSLDLSSLAIMSNGLNTDLILE